MALVCGSEHAGVAVLRDRAALQAFCELPVVAVVAVIDRTVCVVGVVWRPCRVGKSVAATPSQKRANEGGGRV